MNTKRRFLTSLGVVCVLVLLGAACSNSSVRNTEVAKSTTTTSTEWRTYVNQKLGFSINIPTKVYSGYACPDTEYSDLTVVENYDSVAFGINCDGVVELPGNAWTIRVYDSVTDNDAIASIFKKTYGDTCVIDPKFVSDGNGNFDVTHISDGKEPDQTNCWINYASYFKYNPKLHKVVTWSTGQEPNFWKNSNNGSYDQSMVDSFKFIQN